MKIGKYHKRVRIVLKRLLNGIIFGALILALVSSFCMPFSVQAAQPHKDFVDVSHWNNNQGLPLSFYQIIKRGGYRAAVVKVSESTNYLDPAASVNIANAHTAGLRVHAYHSARFTSTAETKAEANWFTACLKNVGFKSSYGIVVADVELATANRAALTRYANTFLQTMRDKGYRVDLYTGSRFYQSNLDSGKLSIKNPWLARYSNNYQQPAWYNGQRGAWQWTSSEIIDGHFFDVSQDFAGKYTAGCSSTVGQIKIISLVNYLKGKGQPWSYTAREKLAERYGIGNYTGTAAQNLALVAKLMAGIKPAAKPVVKAPVKKTGSSVYTVKRGDTLSGIAETYGTTVAALAARNGIKNVNRIYAGERIELSGAVRASSSKTYTVRRGDSLWKIAREHRTTVSHLKSTNHLYSDLIFPGQKLKY